MLDRTQQPPVKPLSDFIVREPRRMVLDNGLTLNVINGGDSDVCKIDMVFGGGSWHQKQPLQSLFTNRMLREGTVLMNGSQLAEQLDYYGAWLDFSSSPCHSFASLYSLNKYLKETFSLFEQMIKYPSFPQKELEIVRNTNLQLFLVNNAKTDVQAQRLLFKTLLGTDHPLGNRTIEDFKNITSESLRHFHSRYYQSQNCSIYLSGKVNDESVAIMKDKFVLPFGEQLGKAENITKMAMTSKEKRVFREMQGARQNSVRMGCLTIEKHHEDFQKLKVLVTLLGGYFGSRLMTRIREEKGYTYGISAIIAPYPECSMLIIASECAPEYTELLINEVYSEIDRLQQEKVTETELERVKNYLAGDICRGYESAFSLADAWIQAETNGFDGNIFKSTIEAVREITPTEIITLAQRYLCKEKLKEIVVGQKV